MFIRRFHTSGNYPIKMRRFPYGQSYLFVLFCIQRSRFLFHVKANLAVKRKTVEMVGFPIKRRVKFGLAFQSFDTVCRTLNEYKMMNIIRKGQLKWEKKYISKNKSSSLKICSVLPHKTVPIIPSPARLVLCSHYSKQSKSNNIGTPHLWKYQMIDDT